MNDVRWTKSAQKSTRFCADSEEKIKQTERIRFHQLLASLFLFLLVFIGQGIFPNKIEQVRGEMLRFISQDIDFRAAFEQLGEAIQGDENIIGDVGKFCMEVFGPESQKKTTPNEALCKAEVNSCLQNELEFLSANHTLTGLAEHYKAPQVLTLTHKDEAPPAEKAEAAPQKEAENPTVPAAGTILLEVESNGEEPPEDCTMNQLSLGGLETITPVLGHMTSSFGYRTHPINGKKHFHAGTDIEGKPGDPIKAFADGEVEFIGEGDSFGQYIQIDHGNGIKSLYAHCSKLCARKGQKVAAGEKIAEVGSTGDSTGPHLHLELKYQTTRFNPAYYIDFLNYE